PGPERRPRRQRQRDEQQTPPRERQRAQRDQLSQNGGEAPEHHADVNLEPGARVGRRRHVPPYYLPASIPPLGYDERPLGPLCPRRGRGARAGLSLVRAVGT